MPILGHLCLSGWPVGKEYSKIFFQDRDFLLDVYQTQKLFRSLITGSFSAIVKYQIADSYCLLKHSGEKELVNTQNLASLIPSYFMLKIIWFSFYTDTTKWSLWKLPCWQQEKTSTWHTGRWEKTLQYLVSEPGGGHSL